jgi:hypothetical protein
MQNLLEKVYVFQAYKKDDINYVRSKFEEDSNYLFSRDDQRVRQIESDIRMANDVVLEAFKRVAIYCAAEAALKESPAAGEAELEELVASIKKGTFGSSTLTSVIGLLGGIKWPIDGAEVSRVEYDEKKSLPRQGVPQGIESSEKYLKIDFDNVNLCYGVPKTGRFEVQMRESESLRRFSQGWAHLLNPVVGYLRIESDFDHESVVKFLEESFKGWETVDPSEVTVKRLPAVDYFRDFFSLKEVHAKY